MQESTRKRIVYVTSAAAITWALFNLPADETKVAVETSPAVKAEVITATESADEKTFINIEERRKESWGQSRAQEEVWHDEIDFA